MATTIAQADAGLLIAARGSVFWADPDTLPGKIEKIVLGQDATYGEGWSWAGDSSAENMLEFSEGDADATVKDTWDRAAVRTVYSAADITGTLNMVALTEDAAKLAYPGAVLDAATKSIAVGDGGTIQKAALIVTRDGTQVSALYFPRLDIKGGLPKMDRENFTEVPLKLTVLGSATQTSNGIPMRYRIFLPRAAG